MINYKYYGLRHDVWGLGVISYFLFAGKFPFEGEADPDICEKVLNEEPDWKILNDRKVDSKIIKLIHGMLIKNPSMRLTIRQVMNNKLFEILEKEERKVINKI